MRIISHRGYLRGPDEALENNPKAIEEAIEKHGLAVEIDLWVGTGDFYLGHEKPKFRVSYEWLDKHKDHLFIHCKDVKAVQYLYKIPEFNWFWHENDKYTFTSQGVLWNHFQNKFEECMWDSVILDFDLEHLSDYVKQVAKRHSSKFAGVCTDHPLRLQEAVDKY